MRGSRAHPNRIPAAPAMMPGFDGINRYFEGASGHWIAQILPGEYYVSRNDEIITTVLGSCISTCMRDPGAGIAGMNHFMLPGDPAARESASARYGLFAMEQLINALLSQGAARGTIQVKVVGGGRVIPGMGDVGRSNIDFVRTYLAAEQMPILVEDVGLAVARRVRFHGPTGRMRVLHLPMSENRHVAERETALVSRIQVRVGRPGDVELF